MEDSQWEPLLVCLLIKKTEICMLSLDNLRDTAEYPNSRRKRLKTDSKNFGLE